MDKKRKTENDVFSLVNKWIQLFAAILSILAFIITWSSM